MKTLSWETSYSNWKANVCIAAVSRSPGMDQASLGWVLWPKWNNQKMIATLKGLVYGANKRISAEVLFWALKKCKKNQNIPIRNDLSTVSLQYSFTSWAIKIICKKVKTSYKETKLLTYKHVWLGQHCQRICKWILMTEKWLPQII